MFLCRNSYTLTDPLNKERTKLKGKWLIIFHDYIILLRRQWIQNIEQKLKAEDTETRKTKT